MPAKSGSRASAHSLGKLHTWSPARGNHSLHRGRNGPETILTFSGTTLCALLQQKVNSGLPRGLLLKPVQQRAHHPNERLCTRNRSRIKGDNRVKKHCGKKVCWWEAWWSKTGLLWLSEGGGGTTNSYDEFQQEAFNLLMRLKCRDKQQQRYQHRMGTSMAQTVTYSQASTSHLTHRCRLGLGCHSSSHSIHSSSYSIHSSSYSNHSSTI